MFKGALILTVGGIIGAVIGVLAGAILGFFGGAVFQAMMSDKDEEKECGPGRVIYKGMSTKEEPPQPDEPTPET